MSTKLYIVGNGFDLHHGLRTSYKHFSLHLQKYNLELFDYLNQYYFYENGKNDLWSNFEENLANLDKDSLLDDLSEFLPVPSADDFRDRDWHAFGIEVEKVVGALTYGLRKEFSRFIIGASGKGVDSRALLKIDPKSKFISFNYTRTMEAEYGVRRDAVLYIHGIAGNADDIVLGHATDPDMFSDEELLILPPEDLSEEDLEQWYEDIGNQHDPIYEGGVQAVNGYFQSSFKDTEMIIEENLQYFSDLNDIREVYVLGHSMSDVDWPYLEKIFTSVTSDCKWVASYFKEEEKNVIDCVMSSLGVTPENYELITLDSLKVGACK